jgi:hypothetical protein
MHLFTDDVLMATLKLDRMSADYALLLARRRAAGHAPFSPAWDAAMSLVEDCEREANRVNQLWRARVALSH